MSTELFTIDGKRKYLTRDEQDRFMVAASQLDRAQVRTLCLTIAFTGCRISEALALTIDRIDLSAKAITFRTLKQRDKERYRSVPCPDTLIDALELVHAIRKTQKAKGGGKGVKLWTWGRTQATKHICSVMSAAEITGTHATPRGLRHGFGVRLATTTRNPRLVQKLLGHTKLENTA
ncbi:MAG: tyrosine-type recombinase/integrase, partial [Alteromonas sp.]|nr:tyrosine-type recombinase/integrase [Alteromonas sp.]